MKEQSNAYLQAPLPITPLFLFPEMTLPFARPVLFSPDHKFHSDLCVIKNPWRFHKKPETCVLASPPGFPAKAQEFSEAGSLQGSSPIFPLEEKNPQQQLPTGLDISEPETLGVAATLLNQENHRLLTRKEEQGRTEG